MTELEKLKNTNDLSDFAKLLGYKPKTLSYILYKIPNDDKYFEFSIPKKSGGIRKIKSPTEKLKHLQRRLAEHLSKCYEEICGKQKKKDKLSHGFRKDRSIVTNASKHKNKRYVFNADLQDFFPSINFGRVRGFFISNYHFELNAQVATIIAQIACHDNELPQGSPCSPVISNLIGHHLDIRLSALAAKAMCDYTRYADDLTFSTNRKELSKLIATKDSDNETWEASNKLRKEINSAGFSINDGKTSLQYCTSRQMVTGLVVNKKVNIKQEYYRHARSMCHSLFLTDEFYISKRSVTTSTSSGNAESKTSAPQKAQATSSASTTEVEVLTTKGTFNQLEGILSFIYQIKGKHDTRDSKEKRKSPSAVMNLYRKLLFYKHFFALNKPLIVCEGKTDNIYLKCALKNLRSDFDELFQVAESGDVFNIEFLNISKNYKEILSISEGTGGLASLMSMYKKNMEPFKGHGKKQPVIILIDNDSGSDEIKKKLKGYNTSKPFFHFTENLYVIHTPQAADGSETAIEDLFTKKTLKTEIDGKKFNRNANLDSATEYGKIVFAEKVVKAKQKEIDFNGFKEVFNRFLAVIADYEKKHSEPAEVEPEEAPQKKVRKRKVKKEQT